MNLMAEHPGTTATSPSRTATSPSTATIVSSSITISPFSTKPVSTTASASPSFTPNSPDVSTTPASEPATSRSTDVLDEPDYDLSGLTENQFNSFKRLQSKLSNLSAKYRHQKLSNWLFGFRKNNRDKDKHQARLAEPSYDLSGLTQNQKTSFYNLKEKWMRENRSSYSTPEEAKHNQKLFLQKQISGFRKNLEMNKSWKRNVM